MMNRFLVEVRGEVMTLFATLRAIVTLCENAKPGNERVVLDNIMDVAEAAMKGKE
jgi:hypothetical protein